jgi:hypothetical protein
LKNLLYLIPVILFFGCSNPKETWREEVEGFKTINDFIDEFGEPSSYEDFSDYEEKHNQDTIWFEDRFNPNKSVNEIVDNLRTWNDLAEENYQRFVDVDYEYKNSRRQVVKGTVEYNLWRGKCLGKRPCYDSENCDWEWSSTKYDKYGYSVDWGCDGFNNEYNFIWKELPISHYREKVIDRKNRLNQINEMLTEPLFWESWVYNGYEFNLLDIGYVQINESKEPGLKLRMGEPIKPEYKKEYKFFLGKNKYSDDFSDNDLPPSTELKWFGIVWENWDGSLDTSPYSTEYEYINPYTICECLDNSDLTNNPLCQSMFRERYGTTVKNADNIQFEIIKKDYYLNCN